MQIMKPPTTVVRKCRLSHHLFTVFALLLFADFFFSEDLTCIFDVGLQLGPTAVRIMGLETKREELPPFATGKNEGGCDVFSGRWIFDESDSAALRGIGVPVHSASADLKTTRNGVGSPTAAIFPANSCSFNATLMLETLRGKRMMFVGDSLNRGQFASMICLLHSVIPSYAKSMESFDSDSRTVFTAKEYNATIEFSSIGHHFFLNQTQMMPWCIGYVKRLKGRDPSISMENIGRVLTYLVFNTYLWWMTTRFRLGSFDDEVKNVVEMPTMEAYHMAMKSLVRWVQKNMDPEKTRVFFTSMSPVRMQ